MSDPYELPFFIPPLEGLTPERLARLRANVEAWGIVLDPKTGKLITTKEPPHPGAGQYDVIIVTDPLRA